ncbi:MAG TPA: hypothetical protein VGY56_15100 [Verrucomicrobiae bacterium]|nr:hypothetical protein [Verrucomicrobiae bacterium]
MKAFLLKKDQNQSMIENGFNATLFPKRIGRLSYFFRLLLMLAIYYLGFFAIRQCPLGQGLRFVIILTFVVVFVGYLFCFVVMPRLLDFGLPPLAIILFFIPILNTLFGLCLMFGPRDYWQTLRHKTQ